MENRKDQRHLPFHKLPDLRVYLQANWVAFVLNNHDAVLKISESIAVPKSGAVEAFCSVLEQTCQTVYCNAEVCTTLAESGAKEMCASGCGGGEHRHRENEQFSPPKRIRWTENVYYCVPSEFAAISVVSIYSPCSINLCFNIIL